ncbi:endonuclease/exonuclease/phosphatase family protein [Zhengella sp. ZM62]|uniref:endonuclease/exonuclease/phosphatase family protein n=1 Tax=Zhengella sedimenti TaxID=3390035 RepID=UPI003976E7DC
MLLLCLAVLASLAAPLHPALDSIAHFRLHLATLLALASLWAFASGLRRLAAGGMCVVLAATLSSAPFLPGIATTGTAAASDPLRVIQFNARSDNGEIGRAAAFLRDAKPDVILVEEARDGPGQIAELLSGDYPVRVSCLFPEWEGGLLVFSRWPAIVGEPTLCSADSRLAAVRLLVRGTPVTFASLHLKWPWPINQSGHIDRLSPLLAALPHPLVLGGDFNAAPWSHSVDRVARLTHTRVAPGYRPTWLPLTAPDVLRPLTGLPIDHVLVSGGIRIQAFRAGPSVGSDHLPVIADLVLPE